MLEMTMPAYGLGELQAGKSNTLEWRGQNLLGFALMEIRATLRKVNKIK